MASMSRSWGTSQSVGSVPMRRMNTAGFLSRLGPPVGGGRLDQIQPQADRRRFGTVPYAKFVKDARYVHRDRALADEQGACDLAVAVAPGQKDEHLGLPAGEVEPCRSHGGANRLVG